MRDRQIFIYKSADWEALHLHAQSTSERFSADMRTLSTRKQPNATPTQSSGVVAQVLTTKHYPA
jgi:hypothetical protein